MYLIGTAKDMGIILREGSNSREPGELPALLVPIAGGGIRVALWELTIAPLATGINLCVMWTVHRLHGELMTLARCDAEELILEFIPVTAFFVKVFFRDVGDFRFLISDGFAHIPDVSVEQISDNGATWCPKGESGSDEIREGEEIEFDSEFLVIAFLRLFLRSEIGVSSASVLKARP